MGHPDSPCPYGAADGHGDIPKAQQLVQQSGTAGSEHHRLGRGAFAAHGVCPVLHRPAQQDRVPRYPEDNLEHDVLPDDREREDRPPDRLRRLDSGLPEPGRLLSAARCELDSARQQREFRQRQRPVHPAAAGEAGERSVDAAELGCEPVAGAGRVRRQEGVRHGVRLGAGAEVHERPNRLRFGRGAPDIPERLEHLAAQVRARIG